MDEIELQRAQFFRTFLKNLVMTYLQGKWGLYFIFGVTINAPEQNIYLYQRMLS